MDPVFGNFTALHYATADLPQRDRVPFWCDVFAKNIVQIEIEPNRDAPFEASATVRLLPGVGLLSPCHSSPADMQRTPNLIADGDDSVAILVNLEGAMTGVQGRREIDLAAGDATLILHADPARIRCTKTRYLSALISRKIAASSIRDFEGVAMQRLPRDNEALRLLIRYVELLPKELPSRNPELAYSIATHIQDLFALAVGATRDAADLAAERGLRAARLQAIKYDILSNLASHRLTVTAVARRAGITPRYVQLLFEAAGTTFSEYVLERRLARAHRMLSDPQHMHRTVADIAYDSGFGDLSYFNRTFRRRYGAPPTEFRTKPH